MSDDDQVEGYLLRKAREVVARLPPLRAVRLPVDASVLDRIRADIDDRARDELALAMLYAECAADALRHALGDPPKEGKPCDCDDNRE